MGLRHWRCLSGQAARPRRRERRLGKGGSPLFCEAHPRPRSDPRSSCGHDRYKMGWLMLRVYRPSFRCALSAECNCMQLASRFPLRPLADSILDRFRQACSQLGRWLPPVQTGGRGPPAQQRGGRHRCAPAAWLLGRCLRTLGMCCILHRQKTGVCRGGLGGSTAEARLTRMGFGELAGTGSSIKDT